jgi:hypothetical protein
LLLPNPFYRRKIDAPELTASIPLHRLQNKAGSNSVSDTGLDDLARFQVPNKTPDRSHQSGITVIP